MTETKEQFCERLQKAILARFRQKEFQKKKRIEQKRREEDDISSVFARRHNRLVKNWGAY